MMKTASFPVQFFSAAVVAASLPAVSWSQEPRPQYNVVTDAVLYDGGPSLGNSDKVRWDFYKADRSGVRTDANAGGSYDATFEAILPAGRYVGVAALGNIDREVSFEVKDGSVARPKVNFDAAELDVVPKRSPGGDVETQAKTEISRDDFKQSLYGQSTAYVPAGEILLTGSIGPARAQQTLAVKAGEKISYDLVIPSGVVVTKAVYAEGGRAVETDDIRFEAMSAKETLDGSRQSIGGVYGTGKMMEMPAGDFIMRARLGKVIVDQPFTVTAGTRSEVRLNLDAGVLAITAPGAERIDIVETTKDLQGTQKEVSGRYGDRHQETLHPGDYAVKVSYDKKSGREPKEMRATVKAAERTELNIAS